MYGGLKVSEGERVDGGVKVSDESCACEKLGRRVRVRVRVRDGWDWVCFHFFLGRWLRW